MTPEKTRYTGVLQEQTRYSGEPLKMFPYIVEENRGNKGMEALKGGKVPYLLSNLIRKPTVLNFLTLPQLPLVPEISLNH